MMEGLMMAYGDSSANNVNSNSGVSQTPLSMMMMMPPPHFHSSSSPSPHHHHQNSSMMLHETSPNHLQNPNSNNVVDGCYFMGNNNGGSSSSSFSSSFSSVKAKIMAHPHYNRLLAAYVSCQKVGAPPEVVAKLEEACATMANMGRVSMSCIGEDPGLDQFMEAYCEMLTKYEQELTKPFKEAMLFLSAIECQFKALTLTSSDHNSSGFEEAAMERNGSSEEDADVNMNNRSIDPQAEDQELKCQLLRKYSGYLGSLKQEFMKKRKKGKLPKEARQQLMEWWTRHYKWPYPSESQKIALADATGLDQKQINNWFINQRKRHWKPSEEMQLVVMDAAHPPYYFGDVFGSAYPMDISSAML